MRRLFGGMLLMLAASMGVLAASQRNDWTTGLQTSKEISQSDSQAIEMTSTGNIFQLLQSTQGEVKVSCVGSTVQRVSLPIEGELETLARGSDLIAVGTLRQPHSHLTKSGNFIYTVWDFKIDQIIMNNPRSPVTTGSPLSIATPGGKLMIDERPVVADCPTEFKVALEAGREYLLFLDYIVENDAYRLTAPNGFEIAGHTIKGLGEPFQEPRWTAVSKSKLISATKQAVRYAGR